MLFYLFLLISISEGISASKQLISFTSELEMYTGGKVPGNVDELKGFCSCVNPTPASNTTADLIVPLLIPEHSIVEVARPTIEKLCKEGSLLFEGYIKNAGCFKDLQQDWRLFSIIHTRIGNKMADLYEKYSSDRFAHRLRPCIKEYEFSQALGDYIEKNCGFEALMVFKTLYSESEYYRRICTPLEFKKARLAPIDVVDAMLDGVIPRYELRVNFDDIIIRNKIKFGIYVPEEVRQAYIEAERNYEIEAKQSNKIEAEGNCVIEGLCTNESEINYGVDVVTDKM